MLEYGDKMNLFLDSVGKSFPWFTGAMILTAWLVFREKAREIDLDDHREPIMQSVKVTSEMIDDGEIPF